MIYSLYTHTKSLNIFYNLRIRYNIMAHYNITWLIFTETEICTTTNARDRLIRAEYTIHIRRAGVNSVPGRRQPHRRQTKNTSCSRARTSAAGRRPVSNQLNSILCYVYVVVATAGRTPAPDEIISPPIDTAAVSRTSVLIIYSVMILRPRVRTKRAEDAGRRW